MTDSLLDASRNRPMNLPTGIIVAGGSSRRMGQDKALLPYPGADPPRTFLEQLIHVLTFSCSEVFIVTRDQEQASRYAHTGAKIILDRIPGGGPLVGLYSGLLAIHTASAIVVAVDMPFIEPTLPAFMLTLYEEGSALVPLVNGIPQVLLAIYPRSLLPLIEELIQQGQRSLRSLLDSAPVHYIEEAQLRLVDPQLRSFVVVNTPGDLASHAGKV